MEFFSGHIALIFALAGLVGLIVSLSYCKGLSLRRQARVLVEELSLQIEKMQNAERQRSRMAMEGHEELGSGLTRIKFLSERVLRHAAHREEVEDIRIIVEQSNQLLMSLSEIAWSMNSRFDTVGNLVIYLHRYASEYLDEHALNLTFTSSVSEDNLEITAAKRRNIYLIVKELLHNTVKHAHPASVCLDVRVTERVIHLQLIEQQARGFDLKKAHHMGNGIYTIQRRVGRIWGSIDFKKRSDDMLIELVVPLEDGPNYIGTTSCTASERKSLLKSD